MSERSEWLQGVYTRAKDDFNAGTKEHNDDSACAKYTASAARSLIGILKVLQRIDALLDEDPQLAEDLHELFETRRIRL
jgi:hypothetical protein